MRNIAIAFLALCLCFSLVSLAYGAKQAATPVNYTDIVVSIAKIASNPDLTWDQVISYLSHVHWIHGFQPINEDDFDDHTVFIMKFKEPGIFSHSAKGDITIKVSRSKPKIIDDLKYLDGKWQVVVIGSKDKPKIIELFKRYEGFEDRVRLVDAFNTKEFTIVKYKCDFETEASSFGNVVYRVKLKDNKALFLKEEWNCGNRGCLQSISFFALADIANKTECSGDLKIK